MQGVAGQQGRELLLPLCTAVAGEEHRIFSKTKMCKFHLLGVCNKATRSRFITF